MPTYCYTNSKTGQTISRFFSVDDRKKSVKVDGALYKRDVLAEHGGFKNTSCAAWPMKSDAAGVHPSQIGEHKEILRKQGVYVDYDSKTGQAIWENRAHRKQHCNAIGLHDRNGGYGDPM